MTTNSDQSLAALAAAGFPLGAITDEQREVFGSLSTDEVGLLIDIRSRLDEVAPEVQAHTDIAGGGLF